jgi:hypothetical protein
LAPELDSIHTEASDPNVMAISSMGRGARRIGFEGTLACLVLGLSGCGASMPQLRKTAAQDLGCPVSEVDIANVDSDTMYANCFGAEATYSEICEEGKGCKWVRDEELDPKATQSND